MYTDSTKKFSETDIINMLELLIDSIFAMFGGRVYQHNVSIPMGRKCALLQVVLVIYSYEKDFIQELPKKTKRK